MEHGAEILRKRPPLRSGLEHDQKTAKFDRKSRGKWPKMSHDDQQLVANHSKRSETWSLTKTMLKYRCGIATTNQGKSNWQLNNFPQFKAETIDASRRNPLEINRRKSLTNNRPIGCKWRPKLSISHQIKLGKRVWKMSQSERKPLIKIQSFSENQFVQQSNSSVKQRASSNQHWDKKKRPPFKNKSQRAKTEFPTAVDPWATEIHKRNK